MERRDRDLNQACAFIKRERDCLRMHQLGMLKRLSNYSKEKINKKHKTPKKPTKTPQI